MNVEQLVELELAGETEVLGENPPQRQQPTSWFSATRENILPFPRTCVHVFFLFKDGDENNNKKTLRKVLSNIQFFN
jgi:hypothetical protein